MSIEIDIRKKLGDFQLDVRFKAEEEIFAILGGSGCGKSMTLKCIAGILTPDEGYIKVNGRALYDSVNKINLPPQKRSIGYMFQDYALFPNMTVVQNIMAGMGKKPAMDIVDDYIERFHLTGLEKRLPRQLSGGQKQRVALARMMAAEPEILLMDEPLSALDSFLKWQMEEELMDILKKVDKTVLFVSHNRDEVYHLCDMVSVMDKGHIETVQKKEQFFSNPETVAAARIAGLRNIAPAKRVSDYMLEVPEWNMTLELERKIPDDTAFVAVGAHSIKVVKGDRRPYRNTAELDVERVVIQQFESELVLHCGDKEKDGRLRIMLPKHDAVELAGSERVTVHIPVNKLLLLRQ